MNMAERVILAVMFAMLLVACATLMRTGAEIEQEPKETEVHNVD